MDYFNNIGPLGLAILATMFTWFLTALGAASVFLFRKMNNNLLKLILGFSGGVMIAASFWSLLAPAIEISESLGYIPIIPCIVGITLGITITHYIGYRIELKTSPNSEYDTSSILMIVAMTLHNIPEGAAIGVAFGAVTAGVSGATITGAIGLAVGIGLQNFPEGIAVSAPLNASGMTRKKSFFFGQFSGMVEPIAAIGGYFLAIKVNMILPYALAFSAGAMIFVVVEELIPKARLGGNKFKLSTYGFVLGFILMMSLDVALG